MTIEARFQFTRVTKHKARFDEVSDPHEPQVSGSFYLAKHEWAKLDNAQEIILKIERGDRDEEDQHS